jgi:hypothetical protein
MYSFVCVSTRSSIEDTRNCTIRARRQCIWLRHWFTVPTPTMPCPAAWAGHAVRVILLCGALGCGNMGVAAAVTPRESNPPPPPSHPETGGGSTTTMKWVDHPLVLSSVGANNPLPAFFFSRVQGMAQAAPVLLVPPYDLHRIFSHVRLTDSPSHTISVISIACFTATESPVRTTNLTHRHKGCGLRALCGVWVGGSLFRGTRRSHVAQRSRPCAVIECTAQHCLLSDQQPWHGAAQAREQVEVLGQSGTGQRAPRSPSRLQTHRTS